MTFSPWNNDGSYPAIKIIEKGEKFWEYKNEDIIVISEQHPSILLPNPEFCEGMTIKIICQKENDLISFRTFDKKYEDINVDAKISYENDNVKFLPLSPSFDDLVSVIVEKKFFHLICQNGKWLFLSTGFNNN